MEIVESLGSFIVGAIVVYLVMRFRKKNYDGQIVVTKGEDEKITYVLELNGDPAEFQDRKVICFKVTTEPSPEYHEPQ